MTNADEIDAALRKERWYLTVWRYTAGHSMVELVLHGLSSKEDRIVLAIFVSGMSFEVSRDAVGLRLIREETSNLLRLEAPNLLIRCERIQFGPGKPTPMVDMAELEKSLRK